MHIRKGGKIEMKIIEEIKALRREVQYRCRFGHKINALKRNDKRIYVCAGSAVHGNMGDQALGFCRVEFLKKNGISEHEIIEYTSRDRMRYWSQICRSHGMDDIIILRGGGYWGDLWTDGFTEILAYIQQFSQNNVIVFPQSVYFSNTPEGTALLEKSQKIVNSCPRLRIFARDRVSYQLLRNYYPKSMIAMTPDTVLSYCPLGVCNDNRNGVLLCLRDDKEKKVNGLEKCATDILHQMQIAYSYQDTSIQFDMQKLSEREPKLVELWTKFAGARLTITDRLHGMIFSAITGTPCIVFDNIDGKVGHQYEWLKNFPYIKYLENLNDLDDTIKSLLANEKAYQYSPEYLRDDFEPLIAVLKQL